MEYLLEFSQNSGEVPVRSRLLGNLSDAVHHRRVVPASEAKAKLRKRCFCQFTSQVHSDLARNDNRARVALFAESRYAQAELLGDGVLDCLNRDPSHASFNESLAHFASISPHDTVLPKRLIGLGTNLRCPS
jgi:hypothetical protein